MILSVYTIIMCGIYSIINYKKIEGTNIPDPSYYTNFMKTKHRGPDSSNFNVIDSRVILGFHRLAINGLDGSGNQPFYKNGVHLICNGEIYNWKELYENNPDIKRTTTSDCEIILDLYLKYGIDNTCESIRGEWAFIIYDTRSIRPYIVAARDCLGKRPLYRGISNCGKISFASEAMSLVSDDTTIMQVMPGNYYKDSLYDSHHMRREWFNYNTMMPFGQNYDTKLIENEYNILNLINATLRKAVHERANMSDVPVGCYLSGGLDSSLVCALAVEVIGKNLHTFTIGLEGSVDVIAAKKVAKFLGIEKNHSVIIVTMDNVIAAIPNAVKQGSTYDVTTIRCLVYQYLLSEWISKNTNIKVLLTGEGADEMCPGYFEFHSQFTRTDEEFMKLSNKRMSEIYLFDGLRSDRSSAAWGLEVRMPFLDENVIKLFSHIPVHLKRFDNTTMEKSLLRNAFNYDMHKILPYEILFRRKHAFSDAINATKCEKKSFEIIEEYVKNSLPYIKLYPNVTYEASWYKWLYDQCGYDWSMAHQKWLPDIPGLNITDPSATLLPGFKVDDLIE